ncbi:hypothetical protein [Allorhizocola rhizosphaerae]|uniref:hypothetical protein n=1 Tax=Allorhizocola rhizosphaerae TaxID=1872709 RepID=UPI000E3BBBC3|nr:hypothetical protein [Allorhizocola rhizosphaerae]
MSDDQFSKLSKQIADIGSRLDKKIDGLRDEMNTRFEQVDQRFEQVDQRFQAVDKRFEHIDQRFEAVDKRFDIQEQRFKAMLDERFKEFEEGSFDRLAGHLSTEIEGLKGQVASVTKEVRKTNDLVDGLYKHRIEDEKKQAELEGEQSRHRKWIGQLADHTDTRLAPEM